MSAAIVNDLKAHATSIGESAVAQAAAEVATSVLVGGAARAWMQSAENLAEWERVYRACPWGTAFQTPGFSKLWFAHYGDLWTPVLVLGRDRAERLVAIMPLAAHDRVITGVGAHQAEYHGWLSAAADAPRFLVDAVSALAKHLPKHELQLKYLHADAPREALEALRAADRRASLHAYTRGVLDLDKDAISEALKKKGNRSKLNRLRRLGRLEFRVLSAADLERHMDDLTAYCDFRQGAVNDSCPFADDPKKRRFHLDWLRDLPGEVHVSAMFLNDRLISALFLAVSTQEAHIAILAHSPEHAENSPNKFHIYEAALALAGSKVTRLDMTPGGDEWKLRFANRQDTVHELVVYASAQTARLTRLRETVGAAIRDGLSRVGLSPSLLRRVVQPRSLDSAKDESWISYRLDLAAGQSQQISDEVQVNALPTLLKVGAAFAKQPRRAFLSDALRRMEGGERSYTLAAKDGLTCLAWAQVHTPVGDGACLRISSIAFTPGSDSPGRRATVVAALIRDASARSGAAVTSLAVRASDAVAQGIVESVGFVLRKP